MKSPVTSVTFSPAEEAAFLQRVQAKAPINGLYLTGSRCDACGKVLEESESNIKGYATGVELGLCRKCASHVNTPQAIDAAIKAGHDVKASAILLSEAPSRQHEEYEDA